MGGAETLGLGARCELSPETSSAHWSRRCRCGSAAAGAMRGLPTRCRRWSRAIDVDHTGRRLRVSEEVESVAGDVVTVTETTATGAGEPPRAERSGGPFTDTSDNLITVARAT